jgi:DNA (cytosine-5)-methyltransferase 1
MGARKGLPLCDYPTLTHKSPRGADGEMGSLFLTSTPTVWDAIRDLPEADDYAELLERDWVKARFKNSTEYASVLRGDDTDPTDFSSAREHDPTLLTSSRRTVHTDLSKKRFTETAHGDTEPVSRFLKLDPNGISNTIRAGTASDRGAFTSPRPIHPYSARCITVREAARLHSYPDWFRFHVTKWHGFRQIGNSVPPLLGRAVASKVREQLPGSGGPAASIAPGEFSLLSLDMSEAAAYFGVPHDVIPQRNRGVRGKESNG